MEYLFILGRNIELSIAEIINFLENNYLNFKIIDKIKNALLISIGENEKLKEDTIKKLGGTIFIGEVLASGNDKEIITKLNSMFLYYGKENKLNYSLFNFECPFYEKISFYLKKRFKEENLKASEKKLGKILNLQNEEMVFLPSSKNQENYFLFKDNFGKIIQNCDYDEIEKRDMKKPFRRPELSISPRLAKIMINLAKVKENQRILDPFCGVGNILQEALLQKIRVVGVDINPDAIRFARQNLSYFNFDRRNYLLIKKDSSKLKINNIDAIITEPQLGELQKKVPNKEESKKIIKDFENLVIKVFSHLSYKVKGRIVFTSPLIINKNEKIRCNFKFIEEKTNLNLVEGFPIEEFREDSYIGRDIVVLEKKNK
jgi:tRNA G10  N-methylase Trm11